MRWVDAPELSVPYYTFEQIEETGAAVCAYTTRYYRKKGSLDDFFQPFLLPDSDPEEVAFCIRLLAEQFGIDTAQLFSVPQRHLANIHQVTEEDLGPEADKSLLSEIDGLITNLPGVMLQTVGADCPSVYAVDPVHRAIGLCHSGRKGTQYHIAGKMLTEMNRAYGTRPEDVIAAISPGICGNCYEVSEDVAEEFIRDYQQCSDIEGPMFSAIGRRILSCPMSGGRPHIDMKQAIAGTLEMKGVPENQIEISDLCTCCRSDLFYSFRAQGRITNENCAVLMLKHKS